MTHTSDDYNEGVRCQREFWKIIYVISGHGKKIINDRKYPMSPGSLFVIHPDDVTTFQIESAEIDIYNIVFMPGLIREGLRELKNDFGFFAIFGNDFQSSPELRERLYVLDSSKEIGSLVRKMDREYRQKASNYRNMIKLYLQALLIDISRLSTMQARRGRKESIVQYIDHIIHTQYHETFHFDFLAAQIGLNKTYISRLYSSSTGKTITETLQRHRCECAKDMLQSSAKSISEICYACGFNDLSYFYRLFKATFGMNPGQYRKKFRLCN